ncbi:MAG: transposase [Thermoplasmata archaeon]|nr:transposase [Candidatus Sysuiplasma jiujiangense]MBX8639751.1 transposase [Candidatus Sysuiplasma jiujiangense]MBX8642344.1 transposase [Candidatus Sysuiplasma jiujiangense]
MKDFCIFVHNLHSQCCPKYRRHQLVDSIKQKPESTIMNVATEHEWDILAMEVMSDRVRLSVSLVLRTFPHRV